MIVYPVSPMQAVDGSLLSLQPLIAPASARAVPLPAGADPYTSFRIASEQVSISVAAKLDVASVFKGSTSFNDKGFVFDAVAYTDQFSQDPASAIVMTRWGSGMRVAVRLSDIKIDIAGGFGAVAASAQLGLGKAQYEILGLGLGLDALILILGDLPPMGEFGIDAYAKLTTAVYSSLRTYIADHRDRLVPVPFAVGLKDGLETDVIGQARSIYVSMAARSRGKSREWVINRYPDVNPSLLDAVYGMPEYAVDKWLET